MNNVNLIGRTTADPQVRYNPESQKAIARFTLAVDDGFGDNKRTSFINIVAFGKTAENCEKFLAKGKLTGVTGKIQTGSYEKDGQKVYTTDIIADRVEFLEWGDKPQASSGAPAGFEELTEQVPF